MNSVFTGLGLAALMAFTGLAQSQAFDSLGEIPDLQVCPFTCKPGPQGTWQEVTTLTMLNPSSRDDIDDGDAAVFLVDGSGNFLAGSRVILPRRDMDELNVCRTLAAAGLMVPEDGLVYPAGPMHVWRSNHIGRFPRKKDNPSDGWVRAVSESECRIVSPVDERLVNVVVDHNESGTPLIPPVIIGAPEE